MAESTREHWDRFWIEHEAIDDVYSNEDRIVNELNRMEPRGKTVVEVGAGSGRDSLEMARQGARVIVLDYSRPSLRTPPRGLISASTCATWPMTTHLAAA